MVPSLFLARAYIDTLEHYSRRQQTLRGDRPNRRFGR